MSYGSAVDLSIQVILHICQDINFTPVLLMAVQILKKLYICGCPAFPNNRRTEAFSSATSDPIYMSYDPSYLIRVLCRRTKEAWSICARIQISCF